MQITRFKNGNPLNKPKILVEIFCAPNCNRCGRAVNLVQEVITDINNESVHCRKIDVVDEIDYAVSLGIRTTPSIVINRNLIFSATPDKKALKKKIVALM